MPLIETGGLRHYYRMDGNDDRPVLMFSHSLGCDHTQWDAQAADLQPYLPGAALRHSRPWRERCAGGDYSIEALARDALGIVDALGIARFAFCGLSLGGMIGQWLAAYAPDRLTHVVLANTSSRFPDPSVMEAGGETSWSTA